MSHYKYLHRLYTQLRKQTMSTIHRNNPESEECNHLDYENRRDVFAAQMQHQHEQSMKTGTELIAEERQRQISQEGWTPEHDASHRSGELNDAAIGYAQAAAYQARGESLEMILSAVPAGVIRWPWEDSWWKPSEDPIRNLVKAGALIAAEIDRLQRKATK